MLRDEHEMFGQDGRVGFFADVDLTTDKTIPTHWRPLTSFF